MSFYYPSRKVDVSSLVRFVESSADLFLNDVLPRDSKAIDDFFECGDIVCLPEGSKNLLEFFRFLTTSFYSAYTNGNGDVNGRENVLKKIKDYVSESEKLEAEHVGVDGLLNKVVKNYMTYFGKLEAEHVGVDGFSGEIAENGFSYIARVGSVLSSSSNQLRLKFPF